MRWLHVLSPDKCLFLELTTPGLVCQSLPFYFLTDALEEMMRERGFSVDHATIYRWVQDSAPELENRSRPHLKATNDSWRVDETSIKIRKTWTYLSRAVDSDGNTLEFLLSPTRDAQAAKRFARQSAALFCLFSFSRALDPGAARPARPRWPLG